MRACLFINTLLYIMAATSMSEGSTVLPKLLAHQWQLEPSAARARLLPHPYSERLVRPWRKRQESARVADPRAAKTRTRQVLVRLELQHRTRTERAHHENANVLRRAFFAFCYSPVYGMGISVCILCISSSRPYSFIHFSSCSPAFSFFCLSFVLYVTF